MSKQSAAPETDDPYALGHNERVWFDAVLYPNRSLSTWGFLAIMAVIIGVSFTAGLYFWSLGAWPITGFFGLDILLVYLAFRWNYRSGRLKEQVRLSDTMLLVRRVLPNGQTASWIFQPYWVRLSLTHPGEHESEVILAEGRKQVVIGTFLAPEERKDLAEALENALGEARRAEAPV